MKWFWIILLLLVGLLYWYIAAMENCCGPVDSITQSTASAVVPAPSIATKNTPLVSFSCSDDSPKYSNRWGAYRDSILNNLKGNQFLEIKGLDFSDEKNKSGESSLAMARAKKIRAEFKLADDRIEVVEQTKTGNCASNKGNEFFAIKTLTSNAKVIKETKDRSLIYFPTNSTNKLNDNEVEAYLDDVAVRVKQSGERIALTGHTDDQGEPASNLTLGQNRANVIKSYLISKGVPAAKITAISKGETEPVASNSNERGKQQNRRTELQIIK